MRGAMTIQLANERGFSLTDLIATIGLIGVLSTLSVPNMLKYWQNSTVNAGAHEFAAVLARARTLAVTRNTAVCVQVAAPTVTVHLVARARQQRARPGKRNHAGSRHSDN